MKEPVFESVGAIAKHLAFHTKRTHTIIVAIVSIILFLPVPFAPLFLILAYIVYLRHEAESIFMQEFARVNNLTYEKEGNIKTVSGRLFKEGNYGSQRITNVISGSHAGQPIRLFNFLYVVGGRKNRRRVVFTVCEIAFEKTEFPYILLQSRTMFRHGGREFFGDDRDEEVSLEAPFKESFRLFVQQQYEIEALQIFNSDTLQLLKEQGSSFSIEFAGTKAYIYDDTVISTKKALDSLYTVVKKIVDTAGPFINRLHDDFDSLHKYYRKENGKVV